MPRANAKYPGRPKIKYKPVRKPKPPKRTREEYALAQLAKLEARHGLTPARVVKLILQERGLLTNVCRSLNVPRMTLQRYIEKHEDCLNALNQARDAQGDKAEKKLFELIDAGDVRCILYYLSTVHRARGYGVGNNASQAFNDDGSRSPVFVETVNVIAVPSGTFLPKETKDDMVIDAQPA